MIARKVKAKKETPDRAIILDAINKAVEHIEKKFKVVIKFNVDEIHK